MAWDSFVGMTMPKALGGLGIRDFKIFNKALLAKNGWRIIPQPNSFWAQILCAKYFPDFDFLNAKKKAKSFYIWNNLLWCKERTRWHIGDN